MKVSISDVSDAAPKARKSQQNGSRSLGRVLLAMTSEFSSSVYLPIVRQIDAVFVQVSDGAQLRLALRDRGPFDLLLADARLPGETGMSILASMRREGTDIPFVIVQSVHQQLVRIATGGGQGQVLTTRVVSELALIELVENLLLSRKHATGAR